MELKRFDNIYTFNKRRWFSSLIAKITSGSTKISHVFTYLGNGKILDVTVFQRIKIRDLTYYLDEDHDIYFSRIKKDLTIQQIEAGNKFIEESIGKSYSMLQNILIFFKVILNLKRIWDVDKNAYECSEWNSTLWKHMNILINKVKPTWAITPIESYDSTEFYKLKNIKLCINIRSNTK